MRIRTIKPEVCTSLTVAGLTNDSVRLHWERIWLYVDDEGRGIDDARLIKAALFPLDEKKSPKVIEGYQQNLATSGLIRRYKVKGKAYFHVVNWHEHQRIDKPRDSIIPAPEEADPDPNNPGGIEEHSTNGHGAVADASRLEGKGSGREVEGKTLVAPEGDSESPPSFDDFWQEYPRRVDKGHARTAWTAATRKAEPAAIVAGAARLAHDPNLPAEKFIPHPATWLRGERWDDGPLPSLTSRPSGNGALELYRDIRSGRIA